jgi:hypothetical protein
MWTSQFVKRVHTYCLFFVMYNIHNIKFTIFVILSVSFGVIMYTSYYCVITTTIHLPKWRIYTH